MLGYLLPCTLTLKSTFFLQYGESVQSNQFGYKTSSLRCIEVNLLILTINCEILVAVELCCATFIFWIILALSFN